MPRQSKLTNDGENRLFGDLIGQLYIKLRVHLFQSATVIDDTTTIASLTEANYSGYAYSELDPISPGTVTDDFASVDAAKSFSGQYVASFAGNSGADQTVYGCWVEGYDGISVYPFFASNCFDANPEAALNGRVVSGPSDEIVLNINLYLWDYFKRRSQDGRFITSHQLPSSIYVPSLPAAIFDDWWVMLGNNMVDENYNGTVMFTSTDPAGCSPNPVVFSNGTGSTTVSLTVSGLQTIIASDVNDESIQGSLTLLCP